MSDTKQMPVSGGGPDKGKPDGVSGGPGDGEAHGRTPAGESGGGAYPDPQSGKVGSESGFMGHGGQAEITYHGGGQAGGQGGDAPNAATGSDSSDGKERDAPAAPVPERSPRRVESEGRTFEVVESSGIAQAETAGKIGSDANEENEQDTAGSG